MSVVVQGQVSLTSKREFVMLSTSKVLSFIDNKEGFMVYFFEGQRLIHDLALIHNLKGEGFHFLRDSILGSQLLSVFLKSKENFGFYIDSEDPYFRFKIETNFNGYMRTLLLPEEFNNFPEKINGVYRVSKITEGAPDPYNTVIEVKEKTLNEIFNQFFKQSFQVNGKVFLSKDSDQSAMIMKLPNTNIDKIDSPTERMSVDEYWEAHSEFIEQLFSKAHNDQEPIEKEFLKKGLHLIGGKDIQFRCSCSRERMVSGVLGLAHSTSMDDVFQSDNSIETKCDYCKTYYEITREEIKETLKKI